MKKQLLFSLALALGATAAFAYNTGDYVYTTDAKLKVTGTENLIKNGNFASSYDGWLDFDGNALNPEYWTVEAGAGENGENVIQSVSGAADLTGNYMYQAVPFTPGQTLLISFKVKGVEPTTSSTTQKTSNYIDVFANADGTTSKTADRFQQLASTEAIEGEWTTYNYLFTDTVTGGSTGSVVVAFGQLPQGTQISDVQVYDAAQVFDTRISDREFAYAEQLLAIEDFANGKDALKKVVNSLKDFFSTSTADDPDQAESALSSFLVAENKYLDANSYDLASIINSKQLWTTKLQKANGTYGDWYVEGSSRWFHDPADATNIRDYIQASYNLPAGTAKIVKALPAGKYFFSCESMGYRMAGTAAAVRNTPDYKYVVEGAKVFIGADSVSFNLDQRNYERHFIVGSLADGETLNAGFWHPATSVDNKLGGYVGMQNPVLRIVGDNSNGEMEKFITDYVALNNIATQANALKVMLDSAVVVAAKAEYPWGKEALKDTTTKYQAVYTELSAVQPDAELFDVAADSLMQSMRIVRSAINALYTLNLPYTELKAQLAQANESYNDPANAAGDKATFKAVIDKAQALVDQTTAEYNEELALQMTDAKTELKEAQSTFEATTATFAHPSEMPLVNPFFEKYTNQSNVEGWTMQGQTDNGRWKQGSLACYENGKHLTVWRGETAFSQNKAQQNVTLLNSGVYVLSCQAAAANQNSSKDGGRDAATGIYYYGKLAESADSIGVHQIHTDYLNYLDNAYNYGNYYPEVYAVVYVKTDNTPTEIELGFDAMNNIQCNSYQFGGNHVRYMGAKDAFDTALATELAALQTEAGAQYEKIVSLENDVTIDENSHLTYKRIYANLGHAIEYANAAQTDHQKMTAYYQLQDAVKNANVVVAGVKGIFSEPTAKAAQGVYTLSGVKVANSNEAKLAKGLYIINGKKVIVK